MADTPALSPLSAAGSTPQVAQMLLSRARTGSGWFLVIAILSMVNSVIARIGGGLSFIVGLGITQIFDAVAKGQGNDPTSSGMIFAFVLDLAVAGLFLLFWRLTQKGQTSAFVVGMVIYGIDGLIFLMGPQLPALAFHAYALYRIFSGYRSARELQRLTAADPAVAGANPASAV